MKIDQLSDNQFFNYRFVKKILIRIDSEIPKKSVTPQKTAFFIKFFLALLPTS